MVYFKHKNAEGGKEMKVTSYYPEIFVKDIEKATEYKKVGVYVEPGATGAAELVASALALKEGIVPPTIGLTKPDQECDLNYTPLTAVKRELDIALSN